MGELEDDIAAEGPTDADNLQARALCRAGLLYQLTYLSQLSPLSLAQSLILLKWITQVQRQVLCLTMPGK